MKINIEEIFNNLTKKNPNLSSYMVFCRAIDGRNLMSREIKKLFNKLVDKTDYARGEKAEIVENVCKAFGYKGIRQTIPEKFNSNFSLFDLENLLIEHAKRYPYRQINIKIADIKP